MRSNIIAVALTVALAGCYSEGPRRPQEIEVGAGQARLVKADHAANDAVAVRYVTEETEYGAQGVFGLSHEAGSAALQGTTVDQERWVGDLGFRLGTNLGPCRAYIGAGAAPQYAHVSDGLGEHDASWALAGYAAVGAKVFLGSHVALGVEARETSGAVFHILQDKHVDLDERSVALTLGWSF